MKFLLVGLILVVGCCLFSSLPAIRDRLAPRVDLWRARLVYTFFPPEKQVFVPQVTIQADLPLAVITQIPTGTPTSSVTLTPELPQDTPVPTPSPTPLPVQVNINGIHYMDQHFGWNNCGPVNLAMALSYWGWTGKASQVAAWVKPFPEDKNVMPYELADYAGSQANLGAAVRFGGTPELIKNLLANGYPVVLEIGTFRIRETTTGKYSWMGHYQTLKGYDDKTKEYIVNDSYFPSGENYRVPYDTLNNEWRSFNDVFLVVYPHEKEQEVISLLGPYADQTASYQIAYKRASEEVNALTGIDQAFAWYNRGSSQVLLQDYNGAAQAYDESFRLIGELLEAKRPYRLPWYQTGPYFAYFYTGRYQDVINLADIVLEPLEHTGKPYLEESYYWRGRAKYAIGDLKGGIDDVKTSLEYHPGFTPSVDLLSQWGVNS